MVKYFLITSDEDGISINTCNDVGELRKYIEPDEDGEYWFGEPKFFDKIPDLDKGYFWDDSGKNAIIIKGNIIVPKPKKIVQEWEVD